MEALGYVGEEKGKLLVYLVGLSRKLENPLSAIIRSQSERENRLGQSHYIACSTGRCDPLLAGLGSRPSLCGQDAFKRKLLAMEERVGGEAADYYIRILQSSHKIRQAVTITNR